MRAAGAAIEWAVYPGAMHGFDLPGLARILQFGSHTYHLEHDESGSQLHGFAPRTRWTVRRGLALGLDGRERYPVRRRAVP